MECGDTFLTGPRRLGHTASVDYHHPTRSRVAAMCRGERDNASQQ